MPFTTENVRVFLAVLDTGSFSAAARRLGRVPSAVSMMIAQLEAELDIPLFDRSGREPRPTGAALALEPQARQLASQLRQLQTHALALHKGLESRLTLAIAPELLAAPWNDPLALLADEFPSLEVEVVSAPQADALRLLEREFAQLAIVFERPNTNEHEYFQEFGREILVAVIAPSHPVFSDGRTTLRQEHLMDIRQILVAGRDMAKIDPRVVVSRQIWRTDSHLATLSLVRSGLGWAYLPSSLVAPLTETGTLAEITFENISNQLQLWVDVVWLRDRPLGLGARRFIELVREVRDPLQLPARDRQA